MSSVGENAWVRGWSKVAIAPYNATRDDALLEFYRQNRYRRTGLRQIIVIGFLAGRRKNLPLLCAIGRRQCDDIVDQYAGGYSIEIFDSYFYRVRRMIFGDRHSGKVYPMSSFTDVSWTGTGNVTIGSFIVRSYPAGQVHLCRTYDCQTQTSVSLRVGIYETVPAIIGDNDLSSIIVSPGWKIEIFDEVNLQGQSRIFQNAHRTAKLHFKFMYQYKAWNEQTSSFIISTIW